MKKLLALLLAAAILLTLGACGKKDKTDAPAVDLTGTWAVTLNLDALLSIHAMGDINDLIQMMGTQNLTLRMTTDFTFLNGEMTVDPTGFTDFFSQLFASMENWLATDEGDAAFSDYCQKNELNKEDCLQTLFDDTLPAQMANELVHKMGDAAYEVEGDKLYLWNPNAEKDPNGYFQFYCKDDTITVHKVVENGQTTELNDGDFVFKKK